jgi:hypothetical protein
MWVGLRKGMGDGGVGEELGMRAASPPVEARGRVSQGCPATKAHATTIF